MKLMNIVPVTAKGIINDEMIAYIGKYLSPDTQMDTVQITEGSLSIETEFDEVMNSPAVVKEGIKAGKAGYDAIFSNCFGDPGVRALRECVDVPVFGGFEPAIHIALGLADRIGIVTVMKTVMPMCHANLAKGHLDGRVISIRSIEIPVLDLGAHGRLCDALVRESIAAIEQDGIEAVVLGCTGMIDVSETVKERLFEAGYDVPVIEAAQAAVMMLELYAKMGLRPSRLTYIKHKG